VQRAKLDTCADPASSPPAEGKAIDLARNSPAFWKTCSPAITEQRVPERPYVVLSVSASVDGYIDDTTSTWLLLSNDADFDRVGRSPRQR
jgi:hypothetical protein